MWYGNYCMNEPAEKNLNQDVYGCLAWCASCWTWQPQDMAVSENSGFSPQIIHFNRVFHCKPLQVHFGVPSFSETPIFFPEFLGCSGPTTNKLKVWGRDKNSTSEFFPTKKHIEPNFGKFAKSIIFKHANRVSGICMDMLISRRVNHVKMIPFYFETVGIREVCQWSSGHDAFVFSWPMSFYPWLLKRCKPPSHKYSNDCNITYSSLYSDTEPNLECSESFTSPRVFFLIQEHTFFVIPNTSPPK